MVLCLDFTVIVILISPFRIRETAKKDEIEFIVGNK